MPFSNVDLDPKSRHDAFGISQSLLLNDSSHSNINSNPEDVSGTSIQKFLEEAAEVRQQFSDRYGGEHIARSILQRGLTSFTTSIHNEDGNNAMRLPSDLQYTAWRILEARRHNRPFQLSFGGYSVTTGRGNLHQQSFPFVLQNIISSLFQHLGVNITVRNAAIGGAPSFPYGLCLDNFMGEDADVISWDFSMNEPEGKMEGLEAYLRHGLSMKRRPVFIIIDDNMTQQRRDLIQQYVDKKVMIAIVVHTGAASKPFVQNFNDIPDDLIPPGFKEWRKFGTPPEGPGQAKHHPAVKGHEFIGWIIAMHFLSVLEVVAATLLHNFDLLESPVPSFLPPPVSLEQLTAPNLPLSLLYGTPITPTKIKLSNQSNLFYKMNKIQCYTSFEPILSKNLQQLITSGSTAEDIDIMLPKGLMFYNQAWVLDVGQMEKTAKRKLERYGGLGYVDVKKAYYGIHASGVLQMFLPHGGVSLDDYSADNDHAAKTHFQSLIVCEVNEKQDIKEKSCALDQDISYTVGGVVAQNVTYIQHEGFSYLGKKICVNVGIPDTSKVTSTVGWESVKRFGMTLDIEVNAHRKDVTNKQVKCSVSHVIFEELQRE